MLEILSFIKAVLACLLSGGGRLRSLLLQPVLTVLIIAVLFLGWHVLQEAGLEAGLRAALFKAEAGQAARQKAVEAAILQAELLQLAASDRLINQLLETLLRRAPTAARAQLAVFHNGVSGLTGISLLRLDLTHVAVAPGRLPGPPLVNEPLTEWEDRLPTLLAGQCIFLLTSHMRNDFTRARLQGMGVSSVLTCPVTDVRRALLGSVMLTWDGADPVPSGEAMAALAAEGRTVGAQIASVLDLRGPASSPPAAAADVGGAAPGPGTAHAVLPPTP